MFKKEQIKTWLLWFIGCNLPFWFTLAIGFPIHNAVSPDPTLSSRCYAVGNMQAFFSCFDDKESHLLHGTALVNYLIHSMNHFIGGLGYVFIVVTILFLIAAPTILTFWPSEKRTR